MLLHVTSKQEQLSSADLCSETTGSHMMPTCHGISRQRLSPSRHHPHPHVTWQASESPGSVFFLGILFSRAVINTFSFLTWHFKLFKLRDQRDCYCNQSADIKTSPRHGVAAWSIMTMALIEGGMVPVKQACIFILKHGIEGNWNRAEGSAISLGLNTGLFEGSSTFYSTSWSCIRLFSLCSQLQLWRQRYSLLWATVSDVRSSPEELEESVGFVLI